MKSRAEDRTPKHTLASRSTPAESREALLESDADPRVIRAQAELARIQEEHKTLRTCAICGTIVAGIAIISHAAVRRQRAMYEETSR